MYERKGEMLLGKHIQEDSYYGKMGFSLLKIGANEIAPENTNAILEFVPGYGMSVQRINNKVHFSTTTPHFTTKEW